MVGQGLISYRKLQEINLYSLPFFTKETVLERADFTLQLLMFVTAEKERRMFIIFFLSIFVSCCPRGFQLGYAEHVRIMQALTSLPRSQLFLIWSLYSSQRLLWQ